MKLTAVAPPPAPAAPGPSPDPQALLDVIPPALVDQLWEAARQAGASQLIELASRVAEHSPAAADTIRGLANEFRYRDLLRALERSAG